MKKLLLLSGMGLLFIIYSGTIFAGEKAPQKFKYLAQKKSTDPEEKREMDLMLGVKIYSIKKKLLSLGLDPIIIKAVKAENKKGKTIDEIKALDKKWKATSGLENYMKALIDSECGKHLRKLLNSEPYFAEIFVMDDQGANVAMTDKTSDYWQGDEAKFIKSYNKGVGAVFVDNIEFDDSTQAYLVQVSVPVVDVYKVVGAITIGINVDKIE